MRSMFWLAVAAVGFGLMAWSYRAYQRIDPAAPWAAGMMVVADPGGPRAPEDLPVWVAEDGPEPVRTLARLLPLGRARESMVRELRGQRGAGRTLGLTWAEKLLRLSPAEADIGEDMLAAGRLPTPGLGEVLAGAETSQRERVEVAGRALAVVGVLRRYRRAVLMNVKGNLVVAIVLAVAACYEAVEVILMSR